MRELADAERIRAFMRALAREASQPGRVLFTGGATAVLFGWRGRVGLRAAFASIEPRLYRYPAIDPAAFARAVAEVAGAD
jgi:hypothetical protein